MLVIIGEGSGALDQLLQAYKPLLQGQFFQGCQPALVIGAGITRFFRSRDVSDEDAIELPPLLVTRVGEGDDHSEGAAFPGVFKDRFDVAARQRGSPGHVGDFLQRFGC